MAESQNAATIAADPTVQVNPLSAMNAGVSAARNVTDLRTTQFNLQQAQLQPGYQAMRMLMATNPNPSDDDVNAALGGAARISQGGAQAIDGLVQNYTNFRARGGKPADFVRATALGGMSPENQTLIGVGGPASQDTGAGTVYGMRGGALSAAPGQFTPSSFVGGTLTPAQATEFVTVTRPDGTHYQVPRGTLFDGSGGGSGGGGGGGGPAGGGSGGPASAATNNFGNIRAPGGGFASYATPQDGVAAMASNLTSYQDQHGVNTLNDITARWAPKGDGANDPVAYANTISKLTGIDPNAKLDLHDPATLAKIIPAMAQVEHGRPIGVGSDVLSAGINAGISGGRSVAQSAPQGQGGGGGGGLPPASGPFIGATSAQPVGGGGGGIPSFDAYGRPMGQGGGGGIQMPGVARGPGGAPILTPPAPWMGPIWEQSAKEYSTDVSREAGFASRIQPFQSAISIINSHPDLKTGPTSQQWNNWATTLSQYGIKLPSMPGDSVAAYQELSKALHQGLVNSGAFSGTDMARIEAEASSPNMQQQVEAIKELSARQIGYERFQMARLKYFRTLHPGEDPDQSANQYRGQTSQWASNLDPVAFGADHLTDQEIATYLKGLNPAEQQRFRNSVSEAAKLYPDFAKAGR